MFESKCVLLVLWTDNKLLSFFENLEELINLVNQYIIILSRAEQENLNNSNL